MSARVATRFLSVVSLTVLCSTACAAGEVPRVTVTVDGQSVPAVLGTYCWPLVEGEGAFCADATDPADLVKDQVPAVVPPAARMMIHCNPSPSAVAVSQWIAGAPIRQPMTDDGSITLPQEAGAYLYDIFAQWKEGDADYAFTVEVRP